MLDRFRSWLTPPTPAKAETGIGAFWLSNEPHVTSLFANDPQKIAKRAQSIGTSHRWIRAAERVISTSLGSVEWHLETTDDEAVTDESSPDLIAIRDVLEKPYRPLPGDPLRAFPRTRSGLWGITSRHMGLCGYSFWYVDAPTPQGIPTNLLYVNPARMTAAGEKGELVGWILDADARGGGTPLPPESVLMFSLEEADEGWYPAGLVETAMSLTSITNAADRHAASTLRSGGRIPGVFSPSAAAGVMPPDVFTQLEKELRSAHENPEARRRDMVLRGPIEFTQTAATPEQLDLVSLLNLSRDDTLALWGVPASQLGITAPAGLNSGSTKSYDEAALWQKAIHPRLIRMQETIQFQLLDPIAALIGADVELELDEPTFDDDAPKYALAASASSQPLRNVERRELLGLDPFGDPLLDNAVWMPINITTLAEAPVLEASKAMTMPNLEPIRNQAVAAMERDVAKVLDKMRSEISAKVARNASHLERKPTDDDVWWDEDRWRKELEKALKPHAALTAELAQKRIADKLGPPNA